MYVKCFLNFLLIIVHGFVQTGDSNGDTYFFLPKGCPTQGTQTVDMPLNV